MSAFALGFGVWVLSPLVAGMREPWDAAWPFYAIAMLGGGGLLGWCFPRRTASVYSGSWVGQALAFMVLPGYDRGWMLLGIATTGIGSLFGLAAYLAGWGAKAIWLRLATRDGDGA